MENVFNRVAKWNGQRYDREYDHQLTLDLLREEYNEFKNAQSAVEELDALCDLAYVALGAVWKAGEEYDCAALKQASTYFDELLPFLGNPVYFIASILDQAEIGEEDCTWLFLVSMCATMQMIGFGLDQDHILRALNIVCDSNASKSVPSKVTPANIKANGTDKGEFYKAPEIKLQALLEEVCQ